VKTEKLQSDFKRWSRREDWSAWLIVAALVVEAAAVWIFSNGKSFCETIAFVVVDLLIAAGVFGEIFFANRGKAAAAELQQISDEKVANAEARASEATQKAANALERAALLEKDNLSLQKHISPRTMNSEQSKKFMASVLRGNRPLVSEAARRSSGGPARTRTEDQGIHSTPPFPAGVDYLFTPQILRRKGVRDALACY
jgi:hypothetical protein